MDDEFKRKQAAFHKFPNINPDNGKRLIFGKGPYLKFVDKYGPPPVKEVKKPVIKPVTGPITKSSIITTVPVTKSPPKIEIPVESIKNITPITTNFLTKFPPKTIISKPVINRTLSTKPAIKYIKSTKDLMKKYDQDDLQLILKSKNIKLLKTLLTLKRYEKILKDPDIIKLLALNFGVIIDKFTFDNLYNTVIYKEAPPSFDEGTYPMLSDKSIMLLPDLKDKWDIYDKNQWLDKLEIIEDIAYLNREYVTVNDNEYVQYSSLDGNINWNSMFYEYIRQNKYTPNEQLFLFVNDEYGQINEQTKHKLFQDRYATKTRY